MTDEEFEDFLSAAVEELSEKQKQLEIRHGFGSYARWHFDQATERLDLFDDAGVKQIEARVVAIGSYASDSKTWRWAWANESILPALRREAEGLKELGTVTGLGLFETQEAFEIEDESMAWELAALGVRHLGALGAYRAPSSLGPMATFLAVISIRMFGVGPG
jgi:hypothetical protein